MYNNTKVVSTVAELKELLNNFPEETELVGLSGFTTTELYVGETHMVGDRDAEDEKILVFGGNSGL